MILKVVVQVIYFFIFLSSTSADSCGKGYFWRDFYGEIPEDAFPGGIDINNNPIYIGQVLYETLLVPGNIYKNDKSIYFEYIGPKSADKNLKIMCANYFGQFEWVQTKKGEVHLLTARHLIIGGYERTDSNVTTYIGRALIDGDTVVGKVLVGVNHYTGLLTVKDGVVHELETFEILTYNPDFNIDVRYAFIKK